MGLSPQTGIQKNFPFGCLFCFACCCQHWGLGDQGCELICFSSVTMTTTPTCVSCSFPCTDLRPLSHPPRPEVYAGASGDAHGLPKVGGSRLSLTASCYPYHCHYPVSDLSACPCLLPRAFDYWQVSVPVGGSGPPQFFFKPAVTPSLSWIAICMVPSKAALHVSHVWHLGT